MHVVVLLVCAAAACSGAAAAAAVAAFVGPDSSWPVGGRLDVACLTLAALLVVTHAVALCWSRMEIRVMGEATKTGHVAFAGAVMRSAVIIFCFGSRIISTVGPYW